MGLFWLGSRRSVFLRRGGIIPVDPFWGLLARGEDEGDDEDVKREKKSSKRPFEMRCWVYRGGAFSLHPRKWD
jgi:hypothetical protein